MTPKIKQIFQIREICKSLKSVIQTMGMQKKNKIREILQSFKSVIQTMGMQKKIRESFKSVIQTKGECCCIES